MYFIIKGIEKDLEAARKTFSKSVPFPDVLNKLNLVTEWDNVIYPMTKKVEYKGREVLEEDKEIFGSYVLKEFEVGTVLIYYGDPNLHEIIPFMISGEDELSFSKLAMDSTIEYLREIINFEESLFDLEGIIDDVDNVAINTVKDTHIGHHANNGIFDCSIYLREEIYNNTRESRPLRLLHLRADNWDKYRVKRLEHTLRNDLGPSNYTWEYRYISAEVSKFGNKIPIAFTYSKILFRSEDFDRDSEEDMELLVDMAMALVHWLIWHLEVDDYNMKESMSKFDKDEQIKLMDEFGIEADEIWEKTPLSITVPVVSSAIKGHVSVGI